MGPLSVRSALGWRAGSVIVASRYVERSARAVEVEI